MSSPGIITISSARPLLPVPACMVILDWDEDRVLAAVESGLLEFAWNIGCERSRRREVRVWSGSLVSHLLGTMRSGTGIESVLDSVLPKRDLRTTEIQRLWSCSGTLLSSLIREGSLSAAPRQARSGPNSFARVHLDSARQFLRSRRITD